MGGSLSSERRQGISPIRICSHKRKCVIQHEACYETGQNEPSIDKWPSRGVQKNFQKSEKKDLSPLKMLILPNTKPNQTMEKLMRTNSKSGLSRAAFVLSVVLPFLAMARVFAQGPTGANPAGPAASNWPATPHLPRRALPHRARPLRPSASS